MRVRTKKSYEPSFREGALALLERTDRTITAVAHDLGVPPATLVYWYKSAMAKKRKPIGRSLNQAGASPGTETVAQANARLEKENAALRKKVDELEMDRAILKKAATFFAKESE